jgi:serine protease
MMTPAPSSTLTSSTVTFQWTSGTGASEYWLEVGGTTNPQQFYAQGLPGLSAIVSALPTDGRTVSVRLWSHLPGGWQWTGYSYTASTSVPAPAQMAAPVPSSTLTSSTVTFLWTGGTGVSEYWLEVGTTANPQQFYARGLTSLSATVSSLPIDGRTVSVRLWSRINGTCRWTGYTYTALLSTPAPAQMFAPAPSSTLTSPTVTFQWTGGIGVSEYWLEVGTTANPQQFFAQGLTSLSATISGLPIDGSTVTVRLWSNIDGAWQYKPYAYTAK